MLHPLMGAWVVSTFWLFQKMLKWVMGVQISVPVPAFNSCVWMPRRGISGSYGSSMFNFFLRNSHTVFFSDCTTLHSHHQCTKVPMSLHPHQPCFFIIAMLMNLKWYLIVVLILHFPKWLVMLSTFYCRWGGRKISSTHLGSSAWSKN